MSQLLKVIARAQRGEGPRMGFGTGGREKPRAMALGVLARDASGASEAIEADVDFVIVRAGDASEAATAIGEIGETRTPVGVWLSELDVDGAKKLAEAGADFVASPLEGTKAEAVDTDALGHILAVTGEIDDTTLRTLGALGLDGMFVKRPAGEMTLQTQVDLARLAVLSGMDLLVSSQAEVSSSELRVLRDSGAVAIVATDGSTGDELRALNDRLRTIPPKRSKARANDAPLLPTAPPAAEEHDHEHDDD